MPVRGPVLVSGVPRRTRPASRGAISSRAGLPWPHSNARHADIHEPSRNPGHRLPRAVRGRRRTLRHRPHLEIDHRGVRHRPHRARPHGRGLSRRDVGLHVPGGPPRRPAQHARRPGLGPRHQRGRHEPDVPDDGAVAAVCPLWRRLRGRQRRGLDHAGLADGESRLPGQGRSRQRRRERGHERGAAGDHRLVHAGPRPLRLALRLCVGRTCASRPAAARAVGRSARRRVSACGLRCRQGRRRQARGHDVARRSRDTPVLAADRHLRPVRAR